MELKRVHQILDNKEKCDITMTKDLYGYKNFQVM